LSGFFDGEEVGDGLPRIVIEDLEVFSVQTLDEVAGGVGDGDADVYAVYGYADGRGLLGLRLGQSFS
jgi:hypothetical protein